MFYFFTCAYAVFFLLSWNLFSVSFIFCSLAQSSAVYSFWFCWYGFRFKNGIDPSSRNMEKPRTMDDVNVIEKTKPWQLAEIAESGQCRLVTLPESTDSSSKVCLIFSDSYLILKHPFTIQRYNLFFFFFKFRLLGCCIQILVLAFWHLAQVASRSCGSGHAMNRILVER